MEAARSAELAAIGVTYGYGEPQKHRSCILADSAEQIMLRIRERGFYKIKVAAQG